MSLLLERVPPHDPFAESCALGCCLLSRELCDLVAALVRAEDFYRPGTAEIFAAVRRAWVASDDRGVVLVAVSRECAVEVEALESLARTALGGANLAYYCARVRERGEWRAQIIEAERLQMRLFALGSPEPMPPNQPPVIYDDHDIAGMTREAERALMGARAEVYSRGGRLVRARRVARGSVLEPLPAASLAETLSRVAAWKRRTAEGEDRPCKPPRAVVEALLERGTWALREVTTIAEAPCLAPHGRVLEREGWDESGTYVSLDPDRRYEPVAVSPSRDDAVRAAADLFRPFEEFSFVAESDAASAMALVLTLAARPAIDGCVPLFAVRGPVAGCGKGLVVHVASACALGRVAAVSPPQRDGAEERKSLLALGAEGAPVALLDNLEHALGSDVLAAALTAPTFRDRELGKTRTLEVRLPVLCATGNNLQVKGDLARRCLPVDLDPRVERPEARSFQRDLPRWALERHPELLRAALTVLRSHHACDSPEPEGLAAWGSFESWCRVVRSALVWAGVGDPCGGRDRLRADADGGLADLRLLIEEWRRALGAEPHSCAQVLSASGRDDALRAALVGLCGVDEAKLDGRRLGYALRRSRGRIVDGWRVASAGDRSRAWTVSPA